MIIEIYTVEDPDGGEIASYGPYGYASQIAAYEDAKTDARKYRGRVITYTFEVVDSGFSTTDSEVVDDFSEAIGRD